MAMAGERMKQTGYTELSGVCAHPNFQGKGLGRLLSLFVAGQISSRSEQPYLHAYATNTAAIALYRVDRLQAPEQNDVGLVRLRA